MNMEESSVREEEEFSPIRAVREEVRPTQAVQSSTFTFIPAAQVALNYEEMVHNIHHIQMHPSPGPPPPRSPMRNCESFMTQNGIANTA